MRAIIKFKSNKGMTELTNYYHDRILECEPGSKEQFMLNKQLLDCRAYELQRKESRQRTVSNVLKGVAAIGAVIGAYKLEHDWNEKVLEFEMNDGIMVTSSAKRRKPTGNILDKITRLIK